MRTLIYRPRRLDPDHLEISPWAVGICIAVGLWLGIGYSAWLVLKLF